MENNETDPRELLAVMLGSRDVALTEIEKRNIKEMLYTAGEGEQFVNGGGLAWEDFIRAVKIFLIARENGEFIMEDIQL